MMAVALSVIVVWAGILLGCVTNRPVTFWITSIFFVVYLIVEGWCRVVRRE
jgi:ABC-type Mn2+/Zn2+ transport system permease subunit